jgi:hypothetical protein
MYQKLVASIPCLFQFFKDRGVIKMFPLKSGRLPHVANADNIVFITRPEIDNMDSISDNVKG